MRLAAQTFGRRLAAIQQDLSGRRAGIDATAGGSPR